MSATYIRILHLNDCAAFMRQWNISGRTSVRDGFESVLFGRSCMTSFDMQMDHFRKTFRAMPSTLSRQCCWYKNSLDVSHAGSCAFRSSEFHHTRLPIRSGLWNLVYAHLKNFATSSPVLFYEPTFCNSKCSRKVHPSRFRSSFFSSQACDCDPVT